LVNGVGQDDACALESWIDQVGGKVKPEEIAFGDTTIEDIRLIRKLAAERRKLKAQATELSNTNLAKKFGIRRETVRLIADGLAWRNV
jgi:hypothetical protein